MPTSSHDPPSSTLHPPAPVVLFAHKPVLLSAGHELSKCASSDAEVQDEISTLLGAYRERGSRSAAPRTTPPRRQATLGRYVTRLQPVPHDAFADARSLWSLAACQGPDHLSATGVCVPTLIVRPNEARVAGLRTLRVTEREYRVAGRPSWLPSGRESTRRIPSSIGRGEYLPTTRASRRRTPILAPQRLQDHAEDTVVQWLQGITVENAGIASQDAHPASPAAGKSRGGYPRPFAAGITVENASIASQDAHPGCPAAGKARGGYPRPLAAGNNGRKRGHRVAGRPSCFPSGRKSTRSIPSHSGCGGYLPTTRASRRRTPILAPRRLQDHAEDTIAQWLQGITVENASIASQDAHPASPAAGKSRGGYPRPLAAGITVEKREYRVAGRPSWLPSGRKSTRRMPSSIGCGEYLPTPRASRRMTPILLPQQLEEHAEDTLVHFPRGITADNASIASRTPILVWRGLAVHAQGAPTLRLHILSTIPSLCVMANIFVADHMSSAVSRPDCFVAPFVAQRRR